MKEFELELFGIKYLGKPNEVVELNYDILSITKSEIVHRRVYSKFGGYDRDMDIYTMDIAKELYNIGYRKQRVGEWITVGEGITERVVCSNCKSEKGSFMRPPFCNQCGAMMKGGESDA